MKMLGYVVLGNRSLRCSASCIHVVIRSTRLIRLKLGGLGYEF